MIAEVNPYHLSDDMRWMEERIGHERCKGAYAFKSLLDNGAMLSFGSDWPGTSAAEYHAHPRYLIHAAVNRTTLNGKPEGGWFPEQKISVEEALEASLLLHVIDISHPNAFEQTQAVDTTLADLGVVERPRLLALNKVDLLRDEEGSRVENYDEARVVIHGAGAPPRNVVLVSAEKRWGLGMLLDRIADALDGGLEQMEVSAADLLAPAFE